MTRDQMHNTLRYVREQLADERGSDFSGVEALDIVIAELEQEPKWDRLYSWLNDMRLGIAPDETVTDIDERNVRTAQVDLLDEIMEWMVEPQESEETETWNGIHGQITAPKGTFERIFNEADDDNDI